MNGDAIGASELRDLVVEAHNARDLGLFELAGGVEVPDELTDLLTRSMERSPRTMLTRGDLGGLPVAVVWRPDRNERYTPVGHLLVDVENGRAQVKEFEGIDPELVAKAPPGLLVAEWESGALADSGEGEGWL